MPNVTHPPTMLNFPFKGKIIRPENLLSFSNDYLNHLPKVKDLLTSNMGKGKEVIIPVARIESGGQHVVRKMKGQIVNVDDDGFILRTCQDFAGLLYDEPIEIDFRFNNVMGCIPLLPKREKINPFSVNYKEFEFYFSTLKEIRELMAKCLHEDHAATAVFSFGEERANQKKFVECEILKVNKSNFRFKNARTYVEVSAGSKVHYINVNTVPVSGIEYFISKNCFLERFYVTFGVKHQINLHDD